MSKAANDLTARIKRLEAAETRAQSFKPRETISFAPMMELLAVSRPVLQRWCHEIDGFETSGAFVRGGNGIEWEFNPRKTVAYLLRHFRGVAAGQAAKSRRIAGTVGITLPDSEETASMAETKQMIDLTLRVTEAQERQGRFVVADAVAGFIAGYNEELVSELLGVRTKVDPNGNLPPAVRKSLDQELRQLATRLHARAAKFIEGQRAGTQQGATG